MEQELFSQVAAIVRSVLQQPGVNLTEQTSSGDVDGWDSLRHVMIITEVEKVFEIKIDFLDILEIKTIGDICKTIAKNKN